MKKCLKITAVFLSVVMVLLISVGCSPKRELKKASRNITSYSIEAVFCDSEKKLSAVEIVEYVHPYDTEISDLKFNLYGRAFRDGAKILPYSRIKTEDCFPNGINYGDMIINEVLVENKPVEFLFCGEDENALSITLPKTLGRGDKIKVSINFDLLLANCTHRLGFNAGKINLGNWYPVVACMGADGFEIEPYWSNGDPFYSNIANYEVSICYPAKYKISSTGEQVEEVQDGEIMSSKFSALAVRDFAMVLLEDYNTIKENVGETEIKIVSSASDGWINDYLETAKRTLTLFNKIFGVYPYSTLTVVMTDFFQGGMEYPNLVYVSNSVKELQERKKVIVHEIAHQWWYGLVGNDEVDMAWFDEGLAEYSTLLYYENYQDEGVDAKKMVEDTITSYELYLDVIKTLNIDINYSMQLSLDEYVSEYEYVYMVYVKGLLFFDDLRRELGDKGFFNFLKTIVKEYKFKNITKDNFLTLLQKVSRVDMSEFVNNWLEGKVDNFK